MVLQRGQPVPVWGRAKPGERVTVEIAGRSAETQADTHGAWEVRLPPLAAGGPFTLTVAGRTKLTCTDVMVGEVWVCSGQSNMEWPLHSARSRLREVEEADYPNIRLFTVPRRALLKPRPELAAQWQRCVPETAGGFSAVAYYFGRELHRRTGVPIGLINTSWGGTMAEAWASREALASDPFFARALEAYAHELRHPQKYARIQDAALRQWEKRYGHNDRQNLGQGRNWHRPDFKPEGWATMDLPRNWQSAGHNHSGIFWFRREVSVPQQWQGKRLCLCLGAIDKSDVTYFNGVQVGSLTMKQRPDAWCTPRVYPVPGKLVRGGKNLIAVRAYSNVYHGGFIGQPLQMRLFPEGREDQAIFLSGDWKYKVEADFGLVPPPPPSPRGDNNQNTPHRLFDNMIQPLLPYAIRGAIWYQGESNAERAKQYRTLFPLMIRSWREAWRQGDFPFYFVQLANYRPRIDRPVDSTWAELREAQTLALALPETAMALAIDLGETDDIHPRNKLDVGLRLALPALRQVHGFKDLVTSGPLYRELASEKGRLRLHFDHVNGGLVARGPLEGFEIAGADRRFVKANAKIDGQTVLVWHPKVRKPVAARYGWQDNPPSSLYNSSDLPASPFRTDVWPGITK